jgi:pyrimidine operon attenuation protein/uracil phosphoribosyltransferase
MRLDNFSEWLEKSYQKRNGKQLGLGARADAKSRCRRIEQFEGDLDLHFVRDKMQSLLESLTYSQQDANNGISPRHRILIDGDLVSGTASLRSAIRLYRLFCLSYMN